MADHRATYTRARLVAGDRVYDRVRFVLRDGHARAFDTMGALVEQGEVAEVAEASRNLTVLTLVDGTEWEASRKGCGCGGGR